MKAQAAGHLAEASVSPFIGEQVDIARVNAEIARAKMERDILKKRGGGDREGAAVRYAFIKRQRTVWPIIAQCSVLGVRVHRLGRYKRTSRNSDL